MKTIKEILPGFALALMVAAVSKGFSEVVPALGGATLAILSGIVLGNTVFRQTALAAGTKFAETKLLEVAVVLLGATVSFQTIEKIGRAGFLYILIMLISTLMAALWIGRKLNFSKVKARLMAGGNAVCGSSAIASIAPVIDANDEDKGQIITLVNLQGTVMMFILPLIGGRIYGTDSLRLGALIGGTLQSVGQVVASANMLGSQVVTVAMLFKIMRILLLVGVVYFFGKQTTKEKQRANTATTSVAGDAGRRKFPVPWYVVGFLVLCLVKSRFSLPPAIGSGASIMSSWLETTALAAIGLRLDLRKFLKEGQRLLLYALAVGVFQIIAALLAIHFIF